MVRGCFTQKYRGKGFKRSKFIFYFLKQDFLEDRFICINIVKGKVLEESGFKKNETFPGERFIHKNIVKGKVSKQSGLKKHKTQTFLVRGLFTKTL